MLLPTYRYHQCDGIGKRDTHTLNSMVLNMDSCLVIGCREGNSRHSFRLVAGVWVLVGMVMVNSFSGTLISSLTVPKMKPSIKTFQDLAASQDVEIVLRDDTGIGNQILVGQKLLIAYKYMYIFHLN